MAEIPDLSKFCTKCNRFCDHWASECPKGDMLEDWVQLSDRNAMFAFQHAPGAAPYCCTVCRESE